VKGLFWWCYDSASFYVRMFPRFWGELKALAGELEYLSPVLTAPAGDDFLETDTPGIDCMCREHDGNVVCIAVNRWQREVRARFTRTGKNASRESGFCVVSEDRHVAAAGGSFEDDFGPYAVHIYTDAVSVPDLQMTRFLKGTVELPLKRHDPDNLAAASNGATVKTSSANPYYRWGFAGNLIDENPRAYWMGDAATAENPQWIEISFPEETAVGRVRIDARFVGAFGVYGARPGIADYAVQYWNDTDGEWVTVEEMAGNTDEISEHVFTPVRTEKIRILITRSIQTWGTQIDEIEVYAR